MATGGLSTGGQQDWNNIMAAETADSRAAEAAPPVGVAEGVGAVKRSWASVLGQSLPKRDDKNVLEVVLEKDMRGSYIVTEEECANMMRKLGLDLRPGVHVEMVQICPQGRGVIFITLKKAIEIARFCRHEVFQVTRSGTRVVLVKAAGKREVIVTAKGIHPNTREQVVLDYLGKFGKVITNKVVYAVYSEGPLQGMGNGDRSFKMEIKPGNNLGSYHVIDGQKVTLRYPGQQQTCARCHKTSQNCKGRGMARKCEAEGGLKVEFTDYILELWKKIGYSPDNLDLNGVDGEPSVIEQNVENFTPVKAAANNEEKYSGVSIKQFPKNTDHGLIMDFLVESGLPENKKENVNISTNGTAFIRELENEVCLALIDAIHGKKYSDRKMFCNGFIPLTPEKSVASPSRSGNTSEPSVGNPLPLENSTDSAAVKPLPPANTNLPESALNTDKSDKTGKPLPPVGLGTPVGSIPSLVIAGPTHSSIDQSDRMFQDHHISFPQQAFTGFDEFPSSSQLVRRYSLSLLDRSPPENSLASDILGKSPSLTAAASKSCMARIKNLQDSLSDFNSGVESPGGVSIESSSSSDDESENTLKENKDQQFITVNQRNRYKREKRKFNLTPTKDDFLLKKPNTEISPENKNK